MNSRCFLCKSSENDELLYGKFCTKWDLSVHYYCLLLSSNLIQNGESDAVGIFGFLEKDIRQEHRRTSRFRCYICKQLCANVTCCFKKCIRMFHTACGIKNGCLSHFTDTFQSWCAAHVPLNTEQSRHTTTEPCAICFDEMGRFNRISSIQAPCCRNGWFHQRCMRKFAQSAGYFFKCPLCNNADAFTLAMRLRGVFVPQQDAAWELEPNAFQDHLFRPSECDAENCKCPDGRTVDTRGGWCLLICGSCGATSRHRQCMVSSEARSYVCQSCQPIIGEGVLLEDDDSSEASPTCSQEEKLEAVNGIGPSPGSESGIQCSSSEESVVRHVRRDRRNLRMRIALQESDSNQSSVSSVDIRLRKVRRAQQRIVSDDSDNDKEKEQSSLVSKSKTVKREESEDEGSNSSGTSSLSIGYTRRRRSKVINRKKPLSLKVRSDTDSSSPEMSSSSEDQPLALLKKTSEKMQKQSDPPSSSDFDSSVHIAARASKRRRVLTDEDESVETKPLNVSNEENINPHRAELGESGEGSKTPSASTTPPMKPCTSSAANGVVSRSAEKQQSILKYVHYRSSSGYKSTVDKLADGSSKEMKKSGKKRSDSKGVRADRKRKCYGQPKLLDYLRSC
ncbi:PHD finger protein 7 [Anopheles bellator]|uniref:PHD finger protein 7 n=1 Tax=Anopheles bellator TaxID=139047 RepID=UPI0026474817|nr:PHD finger protein 7 [Anopheles bellator]